MHELYKYITCPYLVKTLQMQAIALMQVESQLFTKIINQECKSVQY